MYLSICVCKSYDILVERQHCFLCQQVMLVAFFVLHSRYMFDTHTQYTHTSSPPSSMFGWTAFSRNSVFLLLFFPFLHIGMHPCQQLFLFRLSFFLTSHAVRVTEK